GKVNRNFNAESLQPRPNIQVPKAAPSTTRPAAPQPGLPLPPSPLVAQARPPAPAQTPAPAPPVQPQEAPAAQTAQQAPQIQSQEPPPEAPPEKPKLAFETPAAMGQPQAGAGRLPMPNTSVSEAVRNTSPSNPRGPSGGIMVGDIGSGVGGIGEGINLPPSPGQLKSNLELLSDPMGVDFRPYLVRVLANVRRNWFAIMPESAKLGRRGRVAIQFAIDREGRVPKLVIVGSSGADALDRAAVAGISASNPFPPLPTEFRGSQIRLQFTFNYNMTAN
ncbi:MAG: TonB C-terminal domain-containing protein, partial [Phycisphaerales bacterium]|nr:TonB C-terminal domain-containing protein [Phycisphaerales bacterium]